MLGCVLLSSALLLFYGLGGRDLWDSGETRYALKALTMRQTGNWIVPSLMGQPWLRKPPLLMWLINLFGLGGGGINDWTARLPSAVAGLGTVLLVFWWGQRLKGLRFGAVVGFSLLTTPLFVARARVNDPEPLLAFFITLALFAFYAHYHGWTLGRRWWVPFAAMALATLTKGPMGLVIPWLVIVTYLWSRRDLGALRRMRLGRGLLLYAAITLPWFLAVTFVFHQSVDRILYGEIIKTVSGRGGHEPWVYYIGALFLGFFPWSLFLPALALVWRYYPESDTGARDGLQFCTVWGVVIFLILSVTTKKRFYYAFHLLPPVSLLMGFLWQYVITGGYERHRWIRTSHQYLLAGLACVALVAAAAVGIGAAGLGLPGHAAVADPSPGDLLVMILVFILLCLGTVLLRQGRYRWVPAAMITAVLLGEVLMVQSIIPELYPNPRAREIGERLRGYVKAGAEVLMVDYYSHAVAFYFGRDIPLIPHRVLGPFLAGEKHLLLVTNQAGARTIPDSYGHHRITLCRKFDYPTVRPFRFKPAKSTVLMVFSNQNCDVLDSRAGKDEGAVSLVEAVPGEELHRRFLALTR
ncbi:MAG: ArnT family glycosyltransferase [Candidatus Methylomirabilales bacterium]